MLGHIRTMFIAAVATAVGASTTLAVGYANAQAEQAPPKHVRSTQGKLVLVNGDGFGASGFDVVAYIVEKRAIFGNASHRTTHDGIAYAFASAGNLARFRASPEAFLPQFGGFCTWMLGLDAKLMPSEPTLWRVVEGKLYLSCGGKYLHEEFFVPRDTEVVNDARWNWRNKLKEQ